MLPAILANIACTHIEAGADGVAPSDMMDGHFSHSTSLEEHQRRTRLLWLRCKIRLGFYGPSEPHDSAQALRQKSYQMNFANQRSVGRSSNRYRRRHDIVMKWNRYRLLRYFESTGTTMFSSSGSLSSEWRVCHAQKNAAELVRLPSSYVENNFTAKTCRSCNDCYLSQKGATDF